MGFKRTETLSKCIQNIIQSKKKLIKWQCFLKAQKTLIMKNDVKKMKIGFWVKQCLHALIDFQEDVNEMTKNHTKAVSG